MKILITGGSGFIGTNLVAHFISKGHQVLNVDRLPPRCVSHKEYWKQVDLLDGDKLLRAIHDFQPNYILHMAARTDLDGRDVSDYLANTIGVNNLMLGIAGLTTLQRVIFASSRLVCKIGYQPKSEDDYIPTTAYGESKVLGEKLIRKNAGQIPCSWLIVRPTSIWGPWFDVPYKTFFLTVARGRYAHPGTSHLRKSYGFVGNTVYELERLMEAPEDAVMGNTMYLADYPPIDVAEMANSIQDVLGVDPIRTVPVALLRLPAWIGDGMKALGWHNPPLTSFRLNNLLTPMIHDLEPLRAVVGELPYSMQEGVRTTVAWLKDQGEVN